MSNKLLWFGRERSVVRDFKTGVSIHSHTNNSRESLAFIERLFENNGLYRRLMRRSRRTAQRYGVEINLSRAYWTPPMCPRTAFSCEKGQIENELGLSAMVSITDHDSIAAPMLLRVIPEARAIPVSTEWSIPFRSAMFHLGIHNLPSGRAQELFIQMSACTASRSEEAIYDLLSSLHAIPQVLIVFNHPLWDLFSNPRVVFEQDLEAFLSKCAPCMHAFELNGLRRWEENQRVIMLAARWNQILISGGDRHGTEPNANVNLTNATSFTEWVEELRVERLSNILFMPQYDEPLPLRFYQTFMDAIREYPEHPEGLVRWDQRAFHPDEAGEIKPLGALWESVPPALQMILGVAMLAEGSLLLNAMRSFRARPASKLPDIAGQEGT